MRVVSIIFAIVSSGRSFMFHSVSNAAINNSPEITLHSVLEADSVKRAAVDSRFLVQEQFENDFVSKNKSDYTVYETASEIVFLCKANYPIAWRFPFPEVCFKIDKFIMKPRQNICNIISKALFFSKFQRMLYLLYTLPKFENLNFRQL